MPKSNRREQTPKAKGKKTYSKIDTAVQRGERYRSSDRRADRIDVRNYR